jgi:hypothetical protein
MLACYSTPPFCKAADPPVIEHSSRTPAVYWLLQVCLSVMYNDNQANGLLAMRLLVDLVKHLVRNQLAAYDAQIGEALTYMHKVSMGWWKEGVV